MTRLAHLVGELRRRRLVVVGLSVPVVALVAALAAIAFLTSTGTTSATAGTGTLNAPASVDVANVYGSGTVVVSWSASVTGGGAVAPDGYYVRRWEGSTPSVVGGACGTAAAPVEQLACDDSGVADGTYTYTVVAVFRTWTAESSASTAVTVFNDLTPPDFGSPALTITGSFGPAFRQYLSGTTVFYNPQGSNAAGFTVAAENVTDSETGIDQVGFPALAGFGGGGGVDHPGPYQTSYSWTSSSTASGSRAVTAYNGIGLSSTSSFTVTPDLDAPTGGSVTANGSASDSYNSTGNVSVAHVDFTDTGAGISSGDITRASATLSGDACGPFSGAVVVPGLTETGLVTGCYRYSSTSTDNVGNTATAVSAIVKVDTTGPSTPTLAFSGLSSNAHYDGAGTLYIRPAGGGTFTVTASATDAQSGIQGYTFGSLNSDGGSNLGGSQTGDHFDYTFGASATAPTTPRIVKATNNAGIDSADATYRITADTTAPTGGSITANGGAVDSYNTTGAVAVAKTLFTDGGAGIASNVVTRATATLSGNTCGSFGGAVVVSGATDGGLADGCYLYTLTGTDRVGNVATAVSAIVKVDQTRPETQIAITPSSPTGNGAWYKGPAAPTFTLSATDAGSGVASTLYKIDAGSTQTYGGEVTIPDGSHTITYWSTDNAGNTEASTTTATIKVDTVAPVTALTTTPGSPNGTNGWFKLATVTFTLGVTEATSGVDSTLFTIDGGPAQTYGGAVTINTQGDHTLTFWSTDSAGNVEATGTTHIKLDNVEPTLGVTLDASPVGALFSAPGTLTYKGNATGSFRLVGTVTDATSGAASAAYPAIGTTGWIHASETVTGSSPYTSSSFSWTANPTNPSGYTVTASDAAGNTTTQAIAFVVDNAAPALTTLQMFDTNANGKVDQVKAMFNDTLNASYSAPNTVWTLTNASGGASLSSVSVAGSLATLTLSEGTVNTASGSFQIALTANGNGVRDALGNQSSFAATAVADKAAPIVVVTAAPAGPGHRNTISGTTTEANGTVVATVTCTTGSASLTATTFGAAPPFSWITGTSTNNTLSGSCTATTVHTDTAGNVSATSAPFTFPAA